MKIRIVSVLLFALTGIAFGSVENDADDWVVDWHCLISTESLGRWNIDTPLLDSTSMDAAFTLEATCPGVRLAATGAFKGDSTKRAELRSAFAGLRFPGTPWIGIEGFYHEYTPLVHGLRSPVIEWGWVNVETARGAGVSTGGILGFSGTCRIVHFDEKEVLTDVSVESPWLGFVELQYRRLHLHAAPDLDTPEYILNQLIIDSNLRYLKPYIMVMSSDNANDGDWGLLAEVRGIKPFSTACGDAVIIPSMEFAGNDWTREGDALVQDQQTLRIDLLLEPRQTMTSFGLSGMYDLKNDSLTGGELRASMTTEAALRYSLSGSYFAADRWNADFGLQYRNMDAAAGCMLSFYPDSTRITATAGYTPRGDVSSRLEISADGGGSLDPVCRLNTIAVIGPVNGLFGISWDSESVEYRIELRGLIE